LSVRISILLFLLLVGVSAFAQELEELRSYYQKFEGVMETDQNCLLKIHKAEVNQIILIRHGKPKLSKNGWYTAKMAQEYSRIYDLVKVYDFEKIPVCIFPDDVDTIYSSNLVRAKNTAAKLNINHIPVKSSSLFREFERDIITIPILKMPLMFWLGMSRIMWYSRLHSQTTESKKAANKRSEMVADALIKKSEEKSNAILVAHGMLNKKLVKTLSKRGWDKVYDNGNSYLSVKILAKAK
jgi:broad specificity phosphatase PhoE